MNKEKDDGLDHLFRKNLEDPPGGTDYNEGDWKALEMMLDKHEKRKGFIYWLPVVSSVAALLLLFLGWWAFQPETKPGQTHKIVKNIIKRDTPNTGKNGGATRQPDSIKQRYMLGTTYGTHTKSEDVAYKSKTQLIASAIGTRRDTTGTTSKYSAPGFIPIKITPGDAATTHTQNLVEAPATENVPVSAKKTASFKDILEADKATDKVTTKQAYRRKYALSIVAAPDINGVGSFQQAKVGTNAGVLFTAGVTRKFTINTGAIYSDKPYMTTFDNYHTSYSFSTKPESVTANCQMLDIPINIAYRLFNKGNSKLSVGTGLSSYIMLHENYKFNYDYANAQGPSNYTVPGTGKYILSVGNLNATYEQQLSAKVGVSIQPYLKLPLANIGYSQVKLQTTGVALGLTWNLN